MTIHQGTVFDQSQWVNNSAVILYQISNCSQSEDQIATSLANGMAAAEHFDTVIGWFDLIVHLLAMLSNFLSFAVLCRQRIGGKRMNQLLLLLTVTEVLYTGPAFISELLETVTIYPRPFWLISVEIGLRLCAHNFLSQRNWWVVVIAGVRYLVIAHPLQMKKASCYSHAGLSSLFLFLLIVGSLESLGMTFIFRVVVLTCSDTRQTSTLVWALHRAHPGFKMAEAFVVIFRTVLPTCLVSIFSLLTLTRLYRRSSVRRTRLSAATRTIFFLTLAFVLLELPYGLTCIFCFIDTSDGTQAGLVYVYYSSITSVLVALDSLSNNAIYCAGSATYRHTLLNVIQCRPTSPLPLQPPSTPMCHSNMHGNSVKKQTVRKGMHPPSSDSFTECSNGGGGSCNVDNCELTCISDHKPTLSQRAQLLTMNEDAHSDVIEDCSSSFESLNR